MEINEAIEIVREYYPSSGKDLNEALETLIPELKESEDERIRKAIGYAIGQSTHSDGTLINGISSEEALAWFERQGSQNLANSAKTCNTEPKFKVGDVIRLKGSAATYTIKRVTDTTYYTNGWSCSIERCEEDYELVEQKPADKVYSIQELLDIGLYALTDAYEKTGAYFDIGYNPQLVTSGGNN